LFRQEQIFQLVDIFDEVNFNPYLLPTSSIDLNIFAHSDFNVLFNNVSSSRLSINRKQLQPIYTINSPLSLAGYSSSYYAELQDSYESLKSHQLSRYEGTKISSLKYNNYSSASSTYVGDISFGKESTINKNTRKIGLFTEIVSSSFLPGRNRVSLKYLIDDKGGLTELNQRNKHWEDIQRTFVAGDYLNVSQFDNQKFGNQKTTDGDKLIFDSGYTYYPILYFASCSVDPKIYFENLGGASSYKLETQNGLFPANISGSSPIKYPLISGNVYNIFDNVTEGTSYYTAGTSTNFPTYSVQESGDHRASANFNLYLTMSNGGQVTWSFGFYDKNNNIIGTKQTEAVNLSLTLSGTATDAWTYDSCQTNTSITINGISVGQSPINISGTNINQGDTVYKYIYQIYTSINTSGAPEGCILGGYEEILYSKNSTENASAVIACNCPPQEIGDPTKYSIFKFDNQLYNIPNFSTDVSGQTTILFNKTVNPISNLNAGDKIVPKFILESSSTNNFTASLSEGNLIISSLSVSTGYASTTCQYFNSSSISASAAAGNKNLVTFNLGISNFHDKNYQFVPNPLTGSFNSLYNNYGDVDYSFSIKPYDIAITYLSDNTYVESRILSSSYSSSFLNIYLDTQMSNLQISNLQSGSYQRFLILKRVEDETSTYLIFKKREGATSYGLTIPQNIAPDVLNNIDAITREIQQKISTDQSQVTINTF